MQIKFSDEFIADLKKIKHQDKKLVLKIEKQLTLFKIDPKHPSLRLHKLSGKFKNTWSISITKSARMVYVLLAHDIAYFVDIGTHDQVYRK